MIQRVNNYIKGLMMQNTGMKTRLFPTLILIALLSASCAPSAALTEAEATQAVLPAPPEATATQAPVDVESVATEPPTVEVLPVATSRGPNLEATDPSTVSLASGGLQLVEFFRFT
jgi:PBP1b-binding outer membrane lipoprotein LpoB